MDSSGTHLQPHFVLFPFMAQGHMIPLIDIGTMLARRGIKITIVTTPLNAARCSAVLARATTSGLAIQTITVPFPCERVGLPEGFEHFNMAKTVEEMYRFWMAANMLEEPVEKLFEEMLPRPSCIISDFFLPYTARIASKRQICRIAFHGTSAFTLLCMNKVHTTNVLDGVNSDLQSFSIPDLPGEGLEFSKATIPFADISPGLLTDIVETDLKCYGVIVNSFEELEPEYVKLFKKAKADKVWCVGPVSLCIEDEAHKTERGGKSSIDKEQCLKWLDSREPSSVLYACLGTFYFMPNEQIIELGLALEASNRPFIWVLRRSEGFEELDKWISESGFEERTKGRGLLIRGWAPQMLILGHPAVGGYLTPCGWNSTLEGITAGVGVPFITWPTYADQFNNERIIVQVLKIGVSVGAKHPNMGKMLIPKETVKKAIDQLFEGGEGEQRRKRVQELQKLAKRATEKDGSSYKNLDLFVQDVMSKACNALSS